MSTAPKEQPDFCIGGGDDWMPLVIAVADHEAQGPTVANVSTCRSCGKGIVRELTDRGYTDRWLHVRSPR